MTTDLFGNPLDEAATVMPADEMRQRLFLLLRDGRTQLLGVLAAACDNAPVALVRQRAQELARPQYGGHFLTFFRGGTPDAAVRLQLNPKFNTHTLGDAAHD